MESKEITISLNLEELIFINRLVEIYKKDIPEKVIEKTQKGMDQFREDKRQGEDVIGERESENE